jgi:hypothetical protein
MRNREELAQKGDDARARRLDEMRKLLADARATREFLLRNSMLASLRDAAAIE